MLSSQISDALLFSSLVFLFLYLIILLPFPALITFHLHLWFLIVIVHNLIYTHSTFCFGFAMFSFGYEIQSFHLLGYTSFDFLLMSFDCFCHCWFFNRASALDVCVYMLWSWSALNCFLFHYMFCFETKIWFMKLRSVSCLYVCQTKIELIELIQDKGSRNVMFVLS